MKKGIIGVGLAAAMLGVVAAPAISAPTPAYAETVTTVATADALKSAIEQGGSIQLGANITANIVVPTGKTATLDLAGFTLTGENAKGAHVILNNGTLTLTDSSAGKTGAVIASCSKTSALRNGDNATCVINGGTLTRAKADGNTWHTIENFGNMTLNTCKIENFDGMSFAVTNGWNYFDPAANNPSAKPSATMTVNEGVVIDAGTNALKNCRYGTLVINGGKITADEYWALSNENPSDVGGCTVKGGTIKSKKHIAFSNGGNIDIQGGDFRGPEGSVCAQNWSKKTAIAGGTFQNEIVGGQDGIGKYVVDGKAFVSEDGATFTVAPEDEAKAASMYKVAVEGKNVYLKGDKAKDAADKVAAKYKGTVDQTKFTVTFSTNGNGSVDPVTVEVGKSLTLPAVPEVAGYTDGAWYDGDTKVTGEYTPASDVTLTAKWIKKTEPAKPDDTNKPSDQKPGDQKPSDADTQNPAAKPADTKKAAKPAKGGMPATGDNAAVAVAAAGAAGIVAVGAGVVIKRRNNA